MMKDIYTMILNLNRGINYLQITRSLNPNSLTVYFELIQFFLDFLNRVEEILRKDKLRI